MDRGTRHAGRERTEARAAAPLGVVEPVAVRVRGAYGDRCGDGSIAAAREAGDVCGPAEGDSHTQLAGAGPCSGHTPPFEPAGASESKTLQRLPHWTRQNPDPGGMGAPQLPVSSAGCGPRLSLGKASAAPCADRVSAWSQDRFARGPRRLGAVPAGRPRRPRSRAPPLPPARPPRPSPHGPRPQAALSCRPCPTGCLPCSPSLAGSTASGAVSLFSRVILSPAGSGTC